MSRERLAKRLRERIGPVASLRSPPRVSIVVLNRDGAERLRALLDGLANRTDYPDFEVVLVDNGSTDESLSVAGSFAPDLALTVVANPDNRSFSDGNHQGAQRSGGELLLFLNNDVEPIEPGWLTELVACHRSGDNGATAATLLSDQALAPGAEPEEAIQHRGIRFHRRRGAVSAYNVEAPSGQADEAIRCSAVTAACLLIGREEFELAGGFSPSYWYGSEDVDLGFRITSEGLRVVCAGRSMLVHRESSTRRTVPVEQRASRERANRRQLLERWGPQLERAYRLDRLLGLGFVADGRPVHIGIAQPTARASGGLARALAALGCRVSVITRGAGGWSERPADLDYLVVCDPAYDADDWPALPKLALVGDPQGWSVAAQLEGYEILLTARGDAAADVEWLGGRLPTPALPGGPPGRPESDRARAQQLLDILRVRAERLTFFIETGCGAWPPSGGSRLQFIRAVQRELERRGHVCLVGPAGSSAEPRHLVRDVVIDMSGLEGHRPAPAQLNVLWLIDRAQPGSAERCGDYDLVLAASERLAQRLSAQTGVAVEPLALGAATDLLTPSSAGSPAAGIAYVGDFAGAVPRILRDVLRIADDLEVCGTGWEGALEPHRPAMREVSPRQAAEVYSSGAIILAGQRDDLDEDGFIPPQIYEALAAGAFVVAHDMPEIARSFGEGVVTSGSSVDLARVIASFRACPAARAAHAGPGRERVLAEHTVAHRVDALLGLIDLRLRAPDAPLRTDHGLQAQLDGTF
jgi:GT2 family glycosyltransferase/glycosyltransferase involved in cell wall biosynthesis